jgi:hypothetical protein
MEKKFKWEKIINIFFNLWIDSILNSVQFEYHLIFHQG